MKGGLGLLLDERFLDHREPRGHPERAERLVAIGRALHDAGVVARTRPFAPRPATTGEIERVHDEGFRARLEEVVPGRAGRLDPDTYFSPGSWDAALLAAGGAVDLALAALAGEISGGAAFVRPPGHHAEPARAMGFCLLNNVAVAAAAARAAGAARVAIVDWDLHHGNGTQAAFYDDPTVLYASVHQFPYYPGTGAADEIGEGAGRGFTVNVPYPAAMGDADYLFAFDEVIVPVLRGFAPDLVLVSAGFDAHARDPLGGMCVTEDGFGLITRRLVALGRPVVAVLEGGYDLVGLSRSAVAMMRELLDPDPPGTKPGGHPPGTFAGGDAPPLGEREPPAGDPSPAALGAVARVKSELRGKWEL